MSWKDLPVVVPILGFTVWVLIRAVRGKGRKNCQKTHEIYGIPDDLTGFSSCSSCPAKALCEKQKSQNDKL